MEESKNIQEIPQLKRSCTGYNCVCWQDGIYDKCIPYNTCLKCYKKLEKKYNDEDLELCKCDNTKK
jgi:hypothetical protein